MRPSKPPFEQAVEEVITRKGPQDTFDVFAILEDAESKTGKPPTLRRSRIASGVIDKLKKRGQIEVVEKGEGSRSGVYRYIGTSA